MVKTWLALALSCLFIANAHAAESDKTYCGYKDYFHLSDSTHPGIYIVSGYSDSDVVLQIVGPRSFVIRDGYQCRTGYSHVTVAYDDFHWCVLNITDGPFMNHPSINASCNGINYLGTDYDGYGSYSYNIKLN